MPVAPMSAARSARSRRAVAHDHVRGAEEAAPEAHRQPDGSGADDERGLTQAEARQVHRVKPHRQRLDERAGPEVDLRGQPQRLVRADPDVLRIGAGELAEASRHRGRTPMPLPGETGQAGAAGDIRQRGHALPTRKRAGHAAPERCNLARELVPHDRADGQRRHAAAAVAHIARVQVRPADPAIAHRQDHLSGPGSGSGMDTISSGRPTP